MPTNLTPQFSVRAADFVRASIAFFGGYRAASRELGIARSTLSDIAQGRTRTITIETQTRLANAFSHRSVGEAWNLMSGTDIFRGLDPGEKREYIDFALGNRAAWRQDVADMNDAWHVERRQALAFGEPPPESGY